RLYEIRTFDELLSELDIHPASLALVEVRNDNLPQVLECFSSQRDKIHFVALADYSIWNDNKISYMNSQKRKQQVVDVLREAGAQVIIESPRSLQRLLQLRDRFASSGVAFREMDNQSILEWAHSVLPWQD